MSLLLNDTNADIKIYVADLAAYNAGILSGVWIDATLEPDDIYEQISALLAQSPVAGAEEFAIHDYEGFEGCTLYEYEGVESAHTKAVFIEEHGQIGAALLAHVADDIEQAQKAMDDQYRGEFKSVADYAQEFREDSSQVPEHLAGYIDYERMARDFEYSGDIYTISTAHDEVHIFCAY